MPELPEPLPSSAPVRLDEIKVTPRGIEIRGTFPPGFRIPRVGGFSVAEDSVPRPIEWAEVSLWEHRRDTALLARALEDLAGMETPDAEALAAALRPIDEAGREPIELVSRADLRRLADRSQVAGPEMAYGWRAYRVAGAELLTTWQAFVAGVRAAAEWTRG